MTKSIGPQASDCSRATIPVSIINGLLSLVGTLLFLLIGGMRFPRLVETTASFAVAGFCAASAMLFYQCIRFTLNKSTIISGKALFFSAGLYQLFAFTGMMMWGIYLLILNTQDPREWHGDKIDLTGFAAMCFTLSMWPAYGAILFGWMHLRCKPAQA